MDKTILKNFAIDARNQLIEEIQNKAALIGITEEGITPPLPGSTSDLLLFDIQSVDPYMLERQEIRQYERLVDELKQREANADYETAYETLIEEVAYTWFNRLIAIRFMEVNNYMPNRMRVLSSGIDRVNEPELVTNYLDSGLDFNQEELERLAKWRLDGSARSMDAMFQLLFIKQANALNDNLSELFEKTDDYAELLLTISYNNPESVLYQLVHEVPEEYFDVETEDGYGQVEIIGWLYQYYNTEKKAEVFARPKSKKIPKEDIPAVTQLFTPDWIVQYMVQNSLGRLWIEKLIAEGDSRTEKEIAESFKWKYYIPEAEQEVEVKEELIAIRADRKNIQLEEITFMDPAMGSYHIGVYAFDVFMQLYESQGYSPRDAAELIVEKNLYGIDIDERAHQLSYFALMMKARQYNRRILNKSIKLNLHSITESNHINRNHLDYLGTNIDDKEEWENFKENIIEILDLFFDAKEYGSILKIDNKYDFKQLKKFVSNMEEDIQMSFETIGIEKTQEYLFTIISTAEILSSKYNIVVTNPPYMGRGSMNKVLSSYAAKYYPESNLDLFSIFIDKAKQLTVANSYYSLITMESWMFLSTFKKFREKILDNDNISSLIHMPYQGKGKTSLGINFGTSLTVFWNHKKLYSYKGMYQYIRYHEIDQKGVPNEFPTINERYGTSKIGNYKKIPDNPLAYWIDEDGADIFENDKIDDSFIPKFGMSSGGEYIRQWYEANINDIEFNARNSDEFIEKDKTWNVLDKGGKYRRWFGNRDHIILWENNGEVIKNDPKSAVRSPQYFFKKHISWTLVSSGDFSARFFDSGFILDTASNCLYFVDDKEENYILALLNTKVSDYMINILNPTMNVSCGVIGRIPYLKADKIEIVEKLVEINMKIAKSDWNSFEKSWDFLASPLLHKSIQNYPSKTIEESYEKWKEYTNNNFEQLKENEEELNRIFISLYGLEDELTHEVLDKDITVTKTFDSKEDIYEEIKGNQYIQTKEDVVKSFISYAVGCMFGRYSLDEEGLIYAGGEWNERKYHKFKPVKDNVLLITDKDYFKDDIVHRFIEFVEVVYGEEMLEENLEFIADSLTGRGSPREKIRNYFMNNFYKDHCQQYSARGSGKLPIYWMYDSSAGKTRRNSEDAFKALVYMHRYDEDTTGKVRMDYLHKVQREYEYRIDNLEHQMDLSDNAREKAEAEKEIEKLTKQLKELQDYDEKIGHLALSRIPIDLDDGIRVNYDKIQTDENGKKLKILAKR